MDDIARADPRGVCNTNLSQLVSPRFTKMIKEAIGEGTIARLVHGLEGCRDTGDQEPLEDQ